jgi:hypothetical protein
MEELLRFIKNLLDKNKITYWLDCGSLLHLYRDGYLPQDDIDFCLVMDEYEKTKKMLLDNIKEFEHINVRTKELSIKRKGIKCDFIFGEIKEDKFLLYSYKANPFNSNKWNWEWRAIYPKDVYFPLTTYKFKNGLTFPVPAKLEDKLAIHYGKTWRTPLKVPCWTFDLADNKDKNFAPMAVIMTTIERDEILKRCLPSYLQYPIKLYLCDQNKVISQEKEHYYQSLRNKGHIIIHSEYDIGLSVARNKLLDLVEEEFVLLTEDDIELKSNPLQFLSMFHNPNDTNHLGVLGGQLIRQPRNVPQNYEYELSLNDGILEYLKSPNIDLCLNFFIAKSKLFQDIRYDNTLCLCEHTDFFLRLKQLKKWKVGFTQNLIGNHHFSLEGTYKDLRIRARDYYAELFRNKWGIIKVIKNGKIEWMK